MKINRRKDVIVVGAGIFGLACAWSCLQRGHSVMVIDKSGPGSGASGGLVGSLSPHAPDRWNDKKQFQFESLLMQRDYWAEIDGLSKVPSGYARVGRLIPMPSQQVREQAFERQKEAKRNWGRAANWRILNRYKSENPEWLEPAVAPAGMVEDDLSARLFPQQAMVSLSKAIRMRGGEFTEGDEVVGIEGDRVFLRRGEYRANAVILAAGTGSYELLNPFFGSGLGRGVKGQAMQIDAPGYIGWPTIFSNGIYIVAHSDGSVVVGSTSEEKFENPVGTDDKLDILFTEAAKISPAIRGRPVLMRWAGVRPRGPKPDPMIGAVPDEPGLLLATGGYKIGFGIAPKVGEALAAMVDGVDVKLPESFTVEHQIGIDQPKQYVVG